MFLISGPSQFIWSSLGSGIHSPFSMHVAVLGPTSTCPGSEQLNETLVPTLIADSFRKFRTYSDDPTDLLKTGCSHVTVT